MATKTILITGATDGIGKQTALELARLGHRILIHGRDREKGVRTMDEINRDSCNENLALYLADFADFDAVKHMAQEIMREQDQLDVLVNNAGTLSKQRVLNKDGCELTFAVNHLAPFLLTNLLLDLIKSSAPARIVNVSSGAHRSVQDVDFDNLQGEKSYNGYDAYSLSKLANILFTNELVGRLDGSGVSANSLHPGVIDTKLLRMSYSMKGDSWEAGARSSVYLATSPEAEGVSGRYYSSMVAKPTSDLAGSMELQVNFWKVSEELLSDYL